MFLFGDVVRDPERPDDMPLLVAQRQLAGCHPTGATVGPDVHLFFADDRPLSTHDFLLVGKRGLSIFRTEEIEIGLADRVHRVAQAGPQCLGLADSQKPAGRILEINALRQVLHERSEQVPLLFELSQQSMLLQRVPNRVLQVRDIVDLSNQIIRRTRSQSSDVQFVILVLRSHDQRGLTFRRNRRDQLDAALPTDPMIDQINVMPRQSDRGQSIGKRTGPIERESAGITDVEEVACDDEPRRFVINQQHADSRLSHETCSSGHGAGL